MGPLLRLDRGRELGGGTLARIGLVILAGAALLTASPIEQPLSAQILVIEIPIEGTIEMGLAPFVERAVEEAVEIDADALLFRVDTFGGRVDAAVKIRDTLLQAEIPTVVWVEGRAISAGALITLAGKTVLMNEGATIGAAQPIQAAPTGESKPTGEKTVSYFRGEMRATAEATGRDPKVAEAMVDADLEIDEVIESGKLLTLTSHEALALKIADHVVSGRRDLIETMGWTEATIREVRPNWSELMVRFLTHPIMAGLLLSLGGLALLLEMRTPGLGIPGLLGVIFLALFFGSHYLVNLAGNVEIFLFLGGLLLIVLEIFVIPGFGIAGIAGGILLFAGMVLSRVGPQGGFGEISRALGLIVVSFLVTLVLFVLLLRYLPQARWMGHIVLADSQRHEAGFHADQHEGKVAIGEIGRCMTDLRPAGTVLVDGNRLDVITAGEYIDSGRTVKVIEIKGNRIVVEEIAGEEA